LPTVDFPQVRLLTSAVSVSPEMSNETPSAFTNIVARFNREMLDEMANFDEFFVLNSRLRCFPFFFFATFD